MCHKPLILKDDSSWEVWAQPNVLYIHPLTYVIFIYAQSLQLCPTLCNPMDYSLPGSSVHGSFQARILEWVVVPSSRGSSQLRDWICVSWISCIIGEFFTPSHWVSLLFIYQIRSVALSCLTLCNPMNRSTPGLPIHHQLLEFTQIHVHRVSDAIQPSHPLLSPSPPAPNPSQHQSLFQLVIFTWGGQSTRVSALASFLPKKCQGWSPSEWTGWISLQSKGVSRVFSNTTVQKHQFFGTQPSSQSNSHIHTWPQEKP